MVAPEGVVQHSPSARERSATNRAYGIFAAVPFAILGLALSIFLGFRNSAAYDRYWEGRRLWGEVLVSCRILSRQVATLIAPGQISDELIGLRRRMVYKGAAFAHALRHHLRGTAP